MPILQLRGPDKGKCNICGNLAKLTEDHTPPKGCAKPTAVEIQHVASRLSTQGPKRQTISQNGVKYRSLCDKCNSGLLGSSYDPALIKFSNDVTQVLKSKLQLPRVLNIRTEPDRVVRSVFGHLKAQGIERYLHGPTTEEWKAFFFDESLPVPPDVKVYYWLYPYPRRVLIRDAVIAEMGGSEPTPIWMMKYYPLAFVIWDSKTPHSETRLRDLAPLCGRNGASMDVPIDLDFVPHELYLQAPESNQVIMYGQEAVSAVERAAKPAGKFQKR